MTQLFAWDFEGKPEWGFDYGSFLFTSCYSSRQNNPRFKPKVTNFRKVKVVDEIEQKTYLTTEQFIKAYKSLNDEKLKELKVAWRAASSTARYAAWSVAWSVAWHAAWSAAWFAAWSEAWSAADSAAWCAAGDVDLAILTKDKITKEQFNLLMQPWTSCDLSLYAEDWEEVLNPKVEEPKNFGAVVEAEIMNHKPRMKWVHRGSGTWYSEDGWSASWSDFINPTIKSEGVEN